MAQPRLKEHLDIPLSAGLVISMVCILGGLILEKGELQDVAQIAAALIVLGGTLGSVLVSTRKAVLFSVIRRARSIFFDIDINLTAQRDEIIRLAVIARRSGVVSLEAELPKITDPFMAKATRLVADSLEEAQIRHLLELDIAVAEHKAELEAKVFENAGGYAPTIGIIGAVLGLIQVMKRLDNMEQVGRGIAVAFVATVYGVSLANLVLLPISNKIRAKARAVSYAREMLVEGAIAIRSGSNPRLIREMLDAFIAPSKKQRPDDGTPLIAFSEGRKAS